jgi:ATP-dependent Clp protease protease subunit
MTKKKKPVKSPAQVKAHSIFISDEITPESLAIVPELLELSVCKPETPLNVYICSPGGQEEVGFAIYDALMAMPNSITTYGYGQVCSIASLIFQAGDRRLLSENSSFMIHNGSVMLPPNLDFDDFKQIYVTCLKNNHRYYEALSKNTHIPISKITEICEKEYFYSADEAVNIGLADSVGFSFK